MHCPSCGLPIDQPNQEWCPQCGRLLTPRSEQREPDIFPAVSDEALLPHGETGVIGGATASQGIYGPFTPYGQLSPYPPVSGYPPSGHPHTTPAPLPKRKHRTGLIVGIVALVAVVLAACAWGIVVTVQAIHPPNLSAVPRETPHSVYDNSFATTAAGWADNSHCFLRSDGFHVKDGYICFAPLGNESDVDIRVRMQQIAGSTDYPIGIAFRMLEHEGGLSYYIFGIASSGYWSLNRCSVSKCDQLISIRKSNAIQLGIGTENTLEVYAKGSHMDFFINGNVVGSIGDSTYAFGMIGLSCGPDTECVYTNLAIGELD